MQAALGDFAKNDGAIVPELAPHLLSPSTNVKKVEGVSGDLPISPKNSPEEPVPDEPEGDYLHATYRPVWLVIKWEGLLYSECSLEEVRDLQNS